MRLSAIMASTVANMERRNGLSLQAKRKHFSRSSGNHLSPIYLGAYSHNFVFIGKVLPDL
jgi:hypothetical protein